MNRSPRCTPADHRLSRRQWFGSAAAGLGACLGPSVGQSLANAAAKKDKQVLFLWLDGGMSQLESWDPKPNTQFGGPFRSIQTRVPGVRVSELIPRLAERMDRLTVVRGVSTKDNTHSIGVERVQRGDPKNRGVTYPLFGSAVAKLLGPGDSGLPAYLWIKPYSSGFLPKDAGFLGPKFGCLALGDGKPPENFLRPDDLTEADDAERDELRRLADKRYAAGRRPDQTEANGHVYEMAARMQKRRDLFDQSTLAVKDLERYGSDARLGQFDIGRHLLLARRFLEAGVRFVKVTSYGWDTHGDHFNGCLSLMPRFDRAFAALLDDLHDRGMLKNTLVVCMAEFGRTPRINGHLGRDHWPEAWSLAMAGCGLKPGVVVGKTNELGTEVTDDPVDCGHLFHTWFKCLGMDPSAQYDNNGQPLPVAHEEMTPIAAALA